MTAADFNAMFDLWRAGDETGSAAYFTPDGIFHEAKKEPVAGRDNIAAHWKPFFHGGPEWRMTVHDLLIALLLPAGHYVGLDSRAFQPIERLA